jgi:hypothetical protein
MSERWTYEQEKVSVLKLMYHHRQNRVQWGQLMSHPAEDIAWVVGEGEGIERKGLDLLICNIVYLVIINAARKPITEAQIAGDDRTRAEIQSVLDETPIDQLLADIPADEAREIRIDLEILGFIPKDITKPQWG